MSEEKGILILEGLNDAIIGVWNCRAVYDESKILDILIDQFGDHVQAHEWLEYNILNLVIGMEDGPILMTPLEEPDDIHDHAELCQD